MTSKLDIEKRIATFGDPKSNGKWREFVEKNKAADAEEQKRQLRIANHTKQQWGIADKKNGGVKYVGSRQHLYDETPDSKFKMLVENSSVPVSKAPQGSKQHKTDVLTYIDKMKDMYEGDRIPKIADQEIFKNNINRKEPVALKFATPKQVGQLAERLEENRQRTGDMSTWDMMKATAKTPSEKKEIREVILQDYKRNGPKNMAEADLKWIGKGRVAEGIKIDVKGISDSVNTYINAQRKFMEPTRPQPKKIDPDLNSGVASLLGEIYDG